MLQMLNFAPRITTVIGVSDPTSGEIPVSFIRLADGLDRLMTSFVHLSAASCALQDAATLALRDSFFADAVWKNPEIRAAGSFLHDQ